MPVAIPTGGRQFPYAGLDYLLRNATSELYGLGVFELTSMVRAALASGATASAEEVERFALALDQLTRSSRNQLASLHHQLGTFMQEAVVAAYEEARATKGRNVEPYRTATRDAGGRLAAALKSPEFFRGTYDGIAFVNTSFLTSQARQWARLNFGALPNRGSPPGRFEVRWGSIVLGALGYGDQPSGPFMLPRGFFRERAFFPTGPTPFRPTSGIRAWNFLDAGVEVLSRQLGPAYEDLYQRWVVSASRGRGPVSRVVTVGPRSVARGR